MHNYLLLVSKILVSTSLAKKVLLCWIHLVCCILVHSVILFNFFFLYLVKTRPFSFCLIFSQPKLKCLMPLCNNVLFCNLVWLAFTNALAPGCLSSLCYLRALKFSLVLSRRNVTTSPVCSHAKISTGNIHFYLLLLSGPFNLNRLFWAVTVHFYASRSPSALQLSSQI